MQPCGPCLSGALGIPRLHGVLARFRHTQFVLVLSYSAESKSRSDLHILCDASFHLTLHQVLVLNKNDVTLLVAITLTERCSNAISSTSFLRITTMLSMLSSLPRAYDSPAQDEKRSSMIVEPSTCCVP